MKRSSLLCLLLAACGTAPIDSCPTACVGGECVNGMCVWPTGADAGDAGQLDAGSRIDAGWPQDAAIDAGSPQDAGDPPIDAGQPDAGLADSGSEPDAGQPVDAGPPPDAGPPACPRGDTGCICNGGAGAQCNDIDAGAVCDVTSGTCQTCGVTGQSCCDGVDGGVAFQFCHGGRVCLSTGVCVD